MVHNNSVQGLYILESDLASLDLMCQTCDSQRLEGGRTTPTANTETTWPHYKCNKHQSPMRKNTTLISIWQETGCFKLKPFGCVGIYFVPKQKRESKLSNKGETCPIKGYGILTKGYRSLSMISGKLIGVATGNIRWHEDKTIITSYINTLLMVKFDGRSDSRLPEYPKFCKLPYKK